MNDKNQAKLNSMEAYKKTEVSTANRETILLMLYSGAIRFLKSAIAASEKSNIQETGVLSFYRTYNKERFLVVHNLKPDAKTFPLTGLDSLMIVPIIQNEKNSKVENNKLTIAAYATLVLMQKRIQKPDLINRKEEK